jgi:hypothetical protein
VRQRRIGHILTRRAEHQQAHRLALRQQVRLPVAAGRKIVDGQARVEVLALLLARGAARLEAGHRPLGRLAGQHGLLEGADRHRWNVLPARHARGRTAFALAVLAVGSVVGELVGEQPQRQVIELGIVARRIHAPPDEGQ